MEYVIQVYQWRLYRVDIIQRVLSYLNNINRGSTELILYYLYYFVDISQILFTYSYIYMIVSFEFVINCFHLFLNNLNLMFN